jgi:hypothetical protein
LKVAVTDSADFIVILQVERPVQGADHPSKKAPLAGVAVRITTVPAAKDALHLGVHAIPAGLLVTLPLEVPAIATVSL